MKKVFIVLAVMNLGLYACNDAENGNATESTALESQVDTSAKAAIVFPENEYDFGTINEGEKVTHDFSFVNTGDANLIISNAKPSCGCTVPEWPKEPIAPGDTGQIKVVFNSKGKAGKNNKTIRVLANTDPAETILSFNVEVLSSQGPLKELAE